MYPHVLMAALLHQLYSGEDAIRASRQTIPPRIYKNRDIKCKEWSRCSSFPALEAIK